MSLERRIKIFSIFAPDDVSRKRMEQEYYEWYLSISKDAHVEIDNMMLSYSDYTLHMVVHYTINTYNRTTSVDTPYDINNILTVSG